MSARLPSLAQSGLRQFRLASWVRFVRSPKIQLVEVSNRPGAYGETYGRLGCDAFVSRFDSDLSAEMRRISYLLWGGASRGTCDQQDSFLNLFCVRQADASGPFGEEETIGLLLVGTH